MTNKQIGRTDYNIEAVRGLFGVPVFSFWKRKADQSNEQLDPSSNEDANREWRDGLKAQFADDLRHIVGSGAVATARLELARSHVEFAQSA